MLHGHGCLSSDAGIQISKFFVDTPNTYRYESDTRARCLSWQKKKDMGVRVTLHDAKPGAECSPKHCFGLKIHSVDTKITIYFFFKFLRFTSLNSNFVLCYFFYRCNSSNFTTLRLICSFCREMMSVQFATMVDL